ncbi:rRNA maturation RNase YbeY [Sphingomonas antarctica]|uniref:rRNA maturation RNase YbeY n=1 Tax=Sphingomonas antarctica TaxID=2040274 RepID=UPI0039EB9FDF
MLDVAVALEAPWPKGDWEELAEKAVRAGLERTPHAELADLAAVVEVSVRLTSDAEVQTLNRQYRQKDQPTNVLSFPMVQPDVLPSLANSDDGEILLGDIALAHETCAREATERGVTLEAHAAHLIVHGTLHLLGHDHMNDAEAEAMEAIERDAMAALGLHDPYPIEDQ